MSHLQIGSFQIRHAIPGARSTFIADRDGERFALKTHWGSVLDENWRDLSETLSRGAPVSERICTLKEVGVQQELVYAAAPYLDGYNVHQLIKAVGNARETTQSVAHVRAVCWLVAQFARAADERVFASFNPSLFDDEGVAPEELFITQNGEVVMLDPRWTGLRRLASGPETHTLAHLVAYSMPASWRDDNVPERTMFFALSTMLWELLSGYRLFRRESLVATLYRLSEHSVPILTELNPYVSRELSEFVMQALSKPMEVSLLHFAFELEAYSTLDKVSGPLAVSRLVDEAFPAKLIHEADEEGSDSTAGLELFLKQQGELWSYVEESTTFIAAPPSIQKGAEGGLAWLADDQEIKLPARASAISAPKRQEDDPVKARRASISSVATAMMAGGMLCAAVLASGWLFETQRPTLNPPVDDGRSPLIWSSPSIHFRSPSDSMIAQMPDVELEQLPDERIEEVRNFSSTSPSQLNQPEKSVQERFPGRAEGISQADVLLILPADVAVYLGGKRLGQGRVRTQLPAGPCVLSLRSESGDVSSLQTHIRAGTLNIVEVSGMKSHSSP